MTTAHDALPAGLVQHIHSYVAAVNAGDAAAIDRLYARQGVVVPRPGLPMAGPGRVTAIRHLLGLGVRMHAAVRHAYVVDDIALLVVDWSMAGTAPDGTAVEMAGAAADVLRLGPDGQWRYLVDNPFGTT
jgi:ketosteroid isomerase-like protein